MEDQKLVTVSEAGGVVKIEIGPMVAEIKVPVDLLSGNAGQIAKLVKDQLAKEVDALSGELQMALLDFKLEPPVVQPVDRGAVEIIGSGDEATHRELKPNGQQQGYKVLSDEERAKGWVRPLRTAYVHKTCGTLTVMSRQIAETYARDPKFYSGTFCVGCGKHLPLDQFTWDGTKETVGS